LSYKQAVGLANTFSHAIRAILTSPSGSVGDANLFSDRDYEQILSFGNNGKDELIMRDPQLVHNLVAAKGEENPEAPAVCALDGNFTYKQLDRHATRLSHYLVQLGIGPGVIVPVILERTRWAPVSLLAVLKYVPLALLVPQKSVD
jgi:non-ribosomal peptide synthetase component F